MEEFWKAWAAYQVREQWQIYRAKMPFPGVDRVEMRTEPVPSFQVFIKDSDDVFRVTPSAIARPSIRRQDGTVW
jgi:hypothetical protein